MSNYNNELQARGEPRSGSQLTGIGAGLLASLLLLTACKWDDKSEGGRSEDGRPVVASVRVSPETVEFSAVGDTAQLTATAFDAEGNPIEGVLFTWLTPSGSPVGVSREGLVTARANGASFIRVHTPNAITGDAAIVVQQVASTLTITPEEWPSDSVWIGARKQFQAEVRDANGNLFTDAPVTWTSERPTAAFVDETGLVTAIRRSDDGARVVAQSGDASDAVTINIPGDGPNIPGYMYTAWYPRTDSTPLLIVNGSLTLPGAIRGAEFYHDIPFVNGLKPVWPHATVEKFQYEGNRVGLLTDLANGLGTLRIFDRAREPVILALADAIDFQLDGDRVAVLKEGGRLHAKDGTSGDWSFLADGGVVKFQLERDRIGALFDDGSVRVRDDLDEDWVELTSGDAVDFQLAFDRIGLLTSDGVLRIKSELNTPFVEVASGVSSFKLTPGYIGVVFTNGELRVRDIRGTWITMDSEAPRQFEIQSQRIGVLRQDGQFRVSDSIHDPSWSVLAEGGVREFQFQGDRIGVLDVTGRLRIRNGIGGAWLETDSYGDGVAQFRLAVENPVPPKRITPAKYLLEQERCANLDDPNCYPHATYRLPPVWFYGIFCGAFRPVGGASGMGSAIREGSIDPFDEMCAHHDNVDYWYSESAFGEYNPTASCIVRYGLRHGRLTHNGVLLADGYSDWGLWNDAWSRANMDNLYDALNLYFLYTEECPEDSLARFDRDVDAGFD